MPFPSTPYVTAEHTSVGPLTDPSPYVDLSLLGAEFWALVDTSDGTRGRVFKEDETELAVDWISFDNGAETGGLRFKWSGTWSAAGANTVRIYPPLAARASVGTGDTYGSFNAYDANWKMHLPLGEAVNNNVDGYKDQTVNANHGQGVSMSLPAVAGQVGDAQDFDGSADHIDLGTFTDLDGAGAFTISLWMNADEITALDFEGLFTRGLSGQRVPWFYLRQQGASAVQVLLQIETVSGGPEGFFTFTTRPANNVTTHLVATWDGTNALLYIDSVLDATSHITTGNILANTDGNNSIGAMPGFNKFKGWLDDTHVHTNAWSADEVAEEFAATKNPGTYWGVWEFVAGGTTHSVTATSAASFSTTAVAVVKTLVTATSAASFSTVANAIVKTLVTATSAASFSTIANASVKTFVTATSAASFSTVANASFVNEAADVFIEVAVTLTQVQDLGMIIIQEQDLEMIIVQEQELTVVI